MEDSPTAAVAHAHAAAAEEIMDDMRDCLRRLELINMSLPAARLAMAIDALDREVMTIVAKSEISELA